MIDLLSRPAPKADHRLFYGKDASQFGDLWLPDSTGLSLPPVIVFYHGGWWKSKYDLAYAGHLCAALKADGIAVWSVEYRRVGATGGGWPATFDDAAAGFDFLPTLAKSFPLNLVRVATMGHSAGAHLAFWIAGRHHIDPGNPGFVASQNVDSHRIPRLGAIALAGVVDLRMIIDLAGNATFAHDREEVYNLMGGAPLNVPTRYRFGNPGDLLPFNVPQILIQGREDDQIPPELPERWVKKARRSGDLADHKIISAADHFDVVDPRSNAWSEVRDLVLQRMVF